MIAVESRLTSNSYLTITVGISPSIGAFTYMWHSTCKTCAWTTGVGITSSSSWRENIVNNYSHDASQSYNTFLKKRRRSLIGSTNFGRKTESFIWCRLKSLHLQPKQEWRPHDLIFLWSYHFLSRIQINSRILVNLKLEPGAVLFNCVPLSIGQNHIISWSMVCWFHISVSCNAPGFFMLYKKSHLIILFEKQNFTNFTDQFQNWP